LMSLSSTIRGNHSASSSSVLVANGRSLLLGSSHEQLGTRRFATTQSSSLYSDEAWKPQPPKPKEEKKLPPEQDRFPLNYEVPKPFDHEAPLHKIIPLEFEPYDRSKEVKPKPPMRQMLMAASKGAIKQHVPYLTGGLTVAALTCAAAAQFNLFGPLFFNECSAIVVSTDIMLALAVSASVQARNAIMFALEHGAMTKVMKVFLDKKLPPVHDVLADKNPNVPTAKMKEFTQELVDELNGYKDFLEERANREPIVVFRYAMYSMTKLRFEKFSRTINDALQSAIAAHAIRPFSIDDLGKQVTNTMTDFYKTRTDSIRSRGLVVAILAHLILLIGLYQIRDRMAVAAPGIKKAMSRKGGPGGIE